MPTSGHHTNFKIFFQNDQNIALSPKVNVVFVEKFGETPRKRKNIFVSNTAVWVGTEIVRNQTLITNM